MRFKILPIKEISTKGYQVRFESGRADIEYLAESITNNGLICPPTVSKKGDKYYCKIYQLRPNVCRQYPFISSDKIESCKPDLLKYRFKKKL